MNGLQRASRAALALVFVLTLSGCLPTIGGAVGGGSDGGGQSGGGAGEQEVMVDGDTVEVDPAPGIPSLTEIPADFPRDAVPVIDGGVSLAVDLAPGWMLMIRVADPAAGFAEAAGRLTDAGFAVVAEQATGSSPVGSYTSAEYDVQLTSSEDAEGPVVVYIVTLRG